MGTVTVLYGHAYDGKNEEAFKECLERIRRNEADRCVYLVRSDVRSCQLREMVLREFGGCFGFPVTTLPDFIKRLYRQSPGARRELSSLEQYLLVEEVFRQREREGKGRFCFARFREHRGIVLKVQEFVTSVRRIGIASRQKLEPLLRTCSPKRRHVYEELATLFEYYGQRLEALNAIDETGIFLEIARQAASHQLDIRQSVPAPELLVLEGYYELTAPERQILLALFAQFDRSLLNLDTPHNPYNFPDEADTPKPCRIFREMAQYVQSSHCSVREMSARSVSSQYDIRKTLVNTIFNIEDHSPELPQHTGDVLVTAYQDKREEVTEIAREIRRLYHTGKITAFREVGVTFPVLEHYERFIHEIFPAFGIPFTMFQGYALASSPVVVTIFRLLEVVREGYRSETIAHLFASPLVQFERADEEASPDHALNAETYLYLDSLARSLGISGGKEVWHAQLSKYQATDAPVEEAENAVDMQKTIIPTMLDFLAYLSLFEAETPRTAQEWIDCLQQGISRLQIPHRILQSPSRKILETDAAALHAFLNILDTLEQSPPPASGEHARQRLFTLGEFYDFLRLAVGSETYYPPQTFEDSVFIMGRLDTRQVRFSYLFFGGLIERDFPGQETPNIFLSDPEAERLGMPTYKQRVQESDYLFYTNLLNPTEHLYLSYPMQEGETDLLKAVYVEKVLQGQKAFGASEPVDLPASAETSAHPENVFTLSELYQWLGGALTTVDSPHHAIDAVLRFIASARSAVYLENFVTGLRAQLLRTSEQLSQFDGILASDWARQLLCRRYDSHLYSGSEFDLYVRCPLRYFFRRLLGLVPLQDVETGISAVEIGQLLHRIVYRFYADMSGGNGTSVQGNVDWAFLQKRADSAQWIQVAREKMARIGREELEPYAFSGVFWEQLMDTLLAGLQINEEQENQEQGRQGLLLSFIEREARDTDTALPRYLNANFGMFVFPGEDRDADTGYILSGTPFRISAEDTDGRTVAIKLRGQIDRIDVEPEKAQGKRGVVVYDYKTGSVPSSQNIRKGLSFQLPLYMLAARELLPSESFEVVAGGYYQLKSPATIGKKGFLGSKEYARQGYFSGSTRGLLETPDEVLRILDEYKVRAIRTAQAITAGQFPPTELGAQDAGCSWCEYQRICRVEHQGI